LERRVKESSARFLFNNEYDSICVTKKFGSTLRGRILDPSKKKLLEVKSKGLLKPPTTRLVGLRRTQDSQEESSKS